MELYELELILNNAHLCHKSEWEQTRMLSYFMVQPHSKKKLDPTDMITFSWEQNGNEQHNTNVSNDDKKRLMDKIKAFQNKAKPNN